MVRTVHQPTSHALNNCSIIRGIGPDDLRGPVSRSIHDVNLSCRKADSGRKGNSTEFYNVIVINRLIDGIGLAAWSIERSLAVKGEP